MMTLIRTRYNTALSVQSIYVDGTPGQDQVESLSVQSISLDETSDQVQK
jgi:hypothetical protein